MLRAFALAAVLSLSAASSRAATLELVGPTLTLQLDPGSTARLSTNGIQLQIDVGAGFSITVVGTGAALLGFTDGQVSDGLMVTVGALSVNGGAGSAIVVDLDANNVQNLTSGVPAQVVRTLTVNGSARLLGGVTLGASVVAGADIEISATTLAADVSLQGSPVNGTVRLTGPVTSDGSARALTLTADTVVLPATMGQPARLRALTVEADELQLAAAVIDVVDDLDTSACEATTMSAAVTLTSLGGDVTLGPIDATGATNTPIVIDTRSAPLVAGTVTLDDIGGATKVSSLGVFAESLSTGDVATRTGQTFRANAIAVRGALDAPAGASIVFAPLDPSHTIGLGTTAVADLILSNDTLTSVIGGATLTIGGDLQSGDIAIAVPGVSFTTNTLLRTPGGTVNLAAGPLSAPMCAIEAGDDAVLGATTVSGSLLVEAAAITQAGPLAVGTLSLAGGSAQLARVDNVVDSLDAVLAGALVYQQAGGRLLSLGVLEVGAVEVNSQALAGPVFIVGPVTTTGGDLRVHGRGSAELGMGIRVAGPVQIDVDAPTGSILLSGVGDASAIGYGVLIDGAGLVHARNTVAAVRGSSPALPAILLEAGNTISAAGGSVSIQSVGGLIALDGDLTATAGASISINTPELQVGATAHVSGDGGLTFTGAGNDIALGATTETDTAALDLTAAKLAHFEPGFTTRAFSTIGDIEVVAPLAQGDALYFDAVGTTTFSADVSTTGAYLEVLGPAVAGADVTLASADLVRLRGGLALGFARLDVAADLELDGALSVIADAVDDHGRVDVIGAVDITGADLAVTVGFTAVLGDSVTIIDNDGADPVVGAFASLPQGAAIGATALHVSYVADGNDVALIVPAALTVAGDSATVAEDSTTRVDVLANDDGDGLALDQVSDPAHGTATIVDDEIEYTPDADFVGEESFTYQACDLAGQCAGATVSITVTPVNDVPVAVDDSASTNEELAVSIPVLANDSDPDGDVLTIASVVDPFPDGTLTIDGNQITFVPAEDVTGLVTLTYTARDSGGLEDTATVTVTIEPDVDDDDDGLADTEEATRATDKDDADSDDDGVGDGAEVDDDLDPNDPDSDADGLQDGTELGLASGGADTDLQVFVPDLDPTSTTDPKVADTDGGGVVDGAEDENHDGRVDAGERDPRVASDDLRGQVIGGGCGAAPNATWLLVLIALGWRWRRGGGRVDARACVRR